MSTTDAPMLASYSPVDEWRKLFHLQPKHSREIVFGFVFRFVTSVIAVVGAIIVIAPFAALNSWQLSKEMLVSFGVLISTTILLGEHIRSRAYERIMEKTNPDADAVSIDKLQTELARPARNFTASETTVKRAMDVVGSLLALILFLPLLLLVAAAIKFDSPGPVLFRVRRAGYDGRDFAMFKFRTMSTVHDGEAYSLAPSKDPRVTNIGRLLRSTSIDELPQLINVLRGDMSLVGPRPIPLSSKDSYRKLLEQYGSPYIVKPGITGWAQVNGVRGADRTPKDVELRFQHDLWYVNNWTIWLDLKILLKTTFEVLRYSAAY